MGTRGRCGRTHFSRNCVHNGKTTNEKATRLISIILQPTHCSIPTKPFDKHTWTTNNCLTNASTGAYTSSTYCCSSNVQTRSHKSNCSSFTLSIRQSSSNESSSTHATDEWNGSTKRFTSLSSNYRAKHTSRTTQRTCNRNS